MRARRAAWGLLACGLLIGWACRGEDGIPDEPSVAVKREATPGGESAELVWGGWHPVPWDTRAATALDRAHRQALAGEREEAIATLNQGLTRWPDCAALLAARGALYGAMGYRRAAARDFEEACATEPDRARAWCALGRMRQELGLPNEALTALERAAELGLQEPELPVIRARAYRQLQRRGRAAEQYTLALAALAHPPFELQAEAAALFYEPAEPAPQAIDRALGLAVRELPTDAAAEERMWLVHALMREGSGEPEALAARLQARGVPVASLAAWTTLALLAVRLDDPETRAELEGGIALGAEAPR